MVETQADEADEATEDEAMNAEPSYAFAKGYGRFGTGYTRLATALGNFEQGDIGAESAVVAHWLTSGLRIAMSRTGWNLMSTRFSLTIFFPRVRTPCGHGAQVIVEGREEQSDGGERNKDPKPTQTKHQSPQAETPPSCSLSSTLGETCETETGGN